ncbi:phytoene desaturase family protein [Cohnella terricola]|uniref:NAD(P)/FAD-dependent oxidoreductase n=1 Tax=Cohnella terricola TaxID=1289167 RepID=A0A559JMS7_9BACL|nr:FAD-dependent oxidoreductase [Cohnella terricola]TVY01173.1 NAD(P)/FAD-dependent oxidoreductase [Cohnella terricola]
MKLYDAAIIGGGLAGLIATIELAEAGKSVVLLEKSGSSLGGRAATQNKDGVLFNLGGHALYLGGVADRLFERYSLALTGSKPSTKGLAIWNGKLASLPGDPKSLLSSELLGWSSKAKLISLFAKLYRLNPVEIPRGSLREWAEAEIRDPMVRHIFYALCRTATYSQDPDGQLAGPTLGMVQRALKSGVKYLDGGWQTIVDRLRDKAIRSGAEIRTGRFVQEIVYVEGEVKGVVCADGERVEARNVVSTASPALTYGMVAGAENTVLRRWKEEAKPSLVASLDLALRRLPSADRHLAIGIDQPVFFSNHSRAARLSDNGTIVMHLTKYSGASQQDPKADEKLLEQTMSLLHPGWEKEVVSRRFLPNMTVVHDYPHMGRSTFEVGPVVPEIKGLYVAGDWAGHGEMLVDAAAASAIRAAEQIVAADRIAGAREPAAFVRA